MRVTWDERKEQKNIKKHKVNFTQASFILRDANRLEYFDVEHSIEENRWILIGNANGRILFVVIAETAEKDLVRIVTARKATKKEQKEYGNSNV